MSRAVATRILMLALALALGACSKDSTRPGPDDQPIFGRMTASVNGHPWAAVDAANGPAALGIVVESNASDRTFTLSGTREGRGDTLFSSIYVILTGPAPGTFDLGGLKGNSGVWLLQHVSDTLATLWSTDLTRTGTVTISRLDSLARTVAGTFSFSAWDADSGQVEVTSGSFDVPYTVSKGPVPPARR